MKFIKLLGLICLICFTFIYTDKIIDVSLEQDEIMIKLKEIENNHKIEPINAKIEDDTITPGKVGKYIDIDESYKQMKKIGYYEESELKYELIYPEISIYNNYNKYIITGNTQNLEVSLIYIITNNKTIDNILNIVTKKNIKITFFIDSTFLYNNISIINKLKDYEIYNYGNLGIYTNENLLIGNNIINNKSENNSTYCLFLKKNIESLNVCSNYKMLSIIPSINGTYQDIKQSMSKGSTIIINNTKEIIKIGTANFLNT